MWRRSSRSMLSRSGNSLERNSPNTASAEVSLAIVFGRSTADRASIHGQGVADLGCVDRGQAPLSGERSTLAALRRRAVNELGFEQQLAQPEHRGAAAPLHGCGCSR